MTYRCKTPVLLIIFNRIGAVRSLVEALRKVRPSLIFVAADGPRGDRQDDESRCNEAIRVLDTIDWECEIRTKISNFNLGVGVNPSEGITWALAQVDQLIILEDDCIPIPGFFRFCDQLLERYSKDPEVMMISGNNHTLGKFKIRESYAFSYHTQTHGWATWRRAWAGYDLYMHDWSTRRSKLNWIKNITGDYISALYWKRIFDRTVKYRVPPYWDYQWTYCCWKGGGRNIIPAKNLVSNIGYGELATNTLDAYHPFSKLETEEMSFPLVHPPSSYNDARLGRTLLDTVYSFTLKSAILGFLNRIRKALFGSSTGRL